MISYMGVSQNWGVPFWASLEQGLYYIGSLASVLGYPNFGKVPYRGVSQNTGSVGNSVEDQNYKEIPRAGRDDSGDVC